MTPDVATIPRLGLTHVGFRPRPAISGVQPHSIELPFPAVESLPEFVRYVPVAGGYRNYNGSICRHAGRVFMAYRAEGWDAVSRVWLAELDENYDVVSDQRLMLPDEDVHQEDPRLVEVQGRLILQYAHVRLGMPSYCRQRTFEVFPDGSVGLEIVTGLGNLNGVEKNWGPFEMPDGHLGFVYKQRERVVIDAATREGFTSHSNIPTRADSSLSGRTPPLRLPSGNYLEFVGGHVPHEYRGARYWYGAHVFRGAAPYDVMAGTLKPLVWGTEASPTIFSPRPRAGHPCCVLPSGIMRDGDDVIVSMGVNDSGVALVRYNLDALLAQMEDVP